MSEQAQINETIHRAISELDRSIQNLSAAVVSLHNRIEALERSDANVIGIPPAKEG